MRNDLRKKRFGRLIVLRDSKKRCKGYVIWICVCDCGNIHEVISNNLISGRTKSCGCFKREEIIKRLWKHGENKTRLYGIWQAMKNRCFRKNNQNYKNYGGRGIKVCSSWHNYMPFRNWAFSHGYQEELVIDRINDDGNYEPSNCQWLTKSENSKKAWRDGRYKNRLSKKEKK
ncbi:MAG: hypothetical protein KAW52_00300 [candidate division Zixibacteria bacterium]|nr:hypothetical protein [candidate division Zixibacteria bacterium]